MINTNDKRFWLWVGKFAFPEIDTKRTKFQFVPPDHHFYILPVIDPVSVRFRNARDIASDMPKTVRVDIQKMYYIGKSRKQHHAFTLRLGYSKELDTLLAAKDSFQFVHL